MKQQDRRPGFLAEIDRILAARAGIPLLRVVVTQDDGTSRTFVFRQDALRASRLAELQRYLMSLEWSARVAITEGANGTEPSDILTWPAHGLIPFPPVPTPKPESTPVRSGSDCPEEPLHRTAIEVRPGDRLSEDVAMNVLWLFCVVGVQERLTRGQIADALSARARPVNSGTLGYTLAAMTKRGLVTNCADEQGRGYFPTEDGRHLIEERQSEEEDC